MLDRLIGKSISDARTSRSRATTKALLEAFLADPTVGQHWRRLGGLETLHSYGVPVSGLMMGKNYEEAADRLRAALPAAHVSFLQSLKTSLSHGKYFLCHAGRAARRAA